MCELSQQNTQPLRLKNSGQHGVVTKRGAGIARPARGDGRLEAEIFHLCAPASGVA